MKTLIKVIIAGILFGCLANVPYGYFQFVRISSCIGFIYLAYYEFENNQPIIGILSVICAILLNPILKIHFTRPLWNNIDLIIGILLIVWSAFDLYKDYTKRAKK